MTYIGEAMVCSGGRNHETARTGHGGSRAAALLLGVVALLAVITAAFPVSAASEQASQPASAAAGWLDAGRDHSCAVIAGGSARCWGYGLSGQLGYANRNTIGDDEAPGVAGPVYLGLGRSAEAISAGIGHTCALLDDRSVRCWGFRGDGRLGYPDTQTIGDDETPGSVGPVDLGEGGGASAITAGGSHTCAILDDGSVRCWGFAGNGRLGYGNIDNIGDDESPGSVGPVDLGGKRASAISAGRHHTCAVLEDGAVRCWGYGLGYGSFDDIGDEGPPSSVPPIDFGEGRNATAISAGGRHTCALLDDRSVRCWGFGGEGRLGYGDEGIVQDPASVGPVDLGPGRGALAISAGERHSCAVLDNGTVRCWGEGLDGRLGYRSTSNVGDDEIPGSVGPVDLGAGRRAVALSAGDRHTCALLDDANVRCWGYGANGRLGLCSAQDIGDDEPPGSVGPIRLVAPADGSSGCPAAVGASASLPATPNRASEEAEALSVQAARRRGMYRCLARARRHARSEARRIRRLDGRARAPARRHMKRHRSRLRRRCLRAWGRTPGPVIGLKAHAVSSRSVLLSFNAAGTDGNRPPAAETYVVKQSPRPIRDSRDFRRARALCQGRCRFDSSNRVGAKLTLTVTDLRPRTTYYYAVAARDNVSRRLGPRSSDVAVRTR